MAKKSRVKRIKKIQVQIVCDKQNLAQELGVKAICVEKIFKVQIGQNLLRITRVRSDLYEILINEVYSNLKKIF